MFCLGYRAIKHFILIYVLSRLPGYLTLYSNLMFFLGLEPDKRMRQISKNYMIFDITKRREYVKTLLMAGKKMGYDFIIM